MEDNLKIKENSFVQEIKDFFKDLVVIVIVVKLVTIFLVSIFIIKGSSMYSTYYDKEMILVDRFSTLKIGNFKKADIKRGDVVVIRPGVDEDKEYFIKRVIGLSGEKIKIENGNVFIKKVGAKDFIKLDEKYLDEINYGKTKTRKDSITYQIPEGKFFLMGDNRANSSDSRSCFYSSCTSINRDNFIKEKNIIGKVLVDFGYFNFSNFSFTHPVITKEGKPISTKPKWASSIDSYIY